MKITSKIILTTVITLGIASGVFAFGAHKYGNMSMHDKADMINQRITSKLDLNQEQQQKFSAMSNKMVSLVKHNKPKTDDHREMIKTLINEQPLDQSALLEMINTKTSAINQHAPEMVSLLANFVDSLSADQKTELKEMMDHRMSHHKEHNNNHHFN